MLPPWFESTSSRVSALDVAAAELREVVARRADGPRHAGCMSVEDNVPRGSLVLALVFCRGGGDASGAWRPLELMRSPTRRAASARLPCIFQLPATRGLRSAGLMPVPRRGR